MRKFLAGLFLFNALCAHAAPASPESIEKIMALTKMESMVDSVYGSMEQMMRQGMQQAMQGKTLTTEQQRALDALPARFVLVIREEYNWAKMKPLYAKLYSDTFDQEEVDSLITFYTSKAGQALLNKMPVMMQKSMELSQSMLQTLLPRVMAEMQAEMDAEVATTNAKPKAKK